MDKFHLCLKFQEVMRSMTANLTIDEAVIDSLNRKYEANLELFPSINQEIVHPNISIYCDCFAINLQNL